MQEKDSPHTVIYHNERKFVMAITFSYRDAKDETKDPFNNEEMAVDNFEIQFNVEGGRPQQGYSPAELPDVVYNCVVYKNKPLSEKEIPKAEDEYIEENWNAIETKACSLIGIDRQVF
jgi:hypothetical protein